MEKLYKNKDWLKQKYLVEKMTIKKMAELSGVDASTIRYNLKISGIPIRKVGKKKEIPKEVLVKGYLEDRLSVAALAKKLSVGNRTISIYLREYGIRKPKKSFKGKLYCDLDWLYQKHIVEGLTSRQIAKLADTTDRKVEEKLQILAFREANKDKEVTLELTKQEKENLKVFSKWLEKGAEIIKDHPEAKHKDRLIEMILQEARYEISGKGFTSREDRVG